MIIYSVSELAKLLGFENFIYRTEGGENFNIYKKIMLFDGNEYSYILSESPPSVGTRYRLSVSNGVKGQINYDNLSINVKTIEEFNTEIRKKEHFLKIFRDEKINNILNSEE